MRRPRFGGTRVKICGITRLEDALDAAALGADALGFNFWPKSKRYITPDAAAKIIAALPPFIIPVGVFVNETPTALQRAVSVSGVQVVQLHGDESPTYCKHLDRPIIKAIPVRDAKWTADANRYDVSAILLDTPSGGFGGTGRAFNWTLVRKRIRTPLLLAGGLTADNVAAAVKLVRPYAVDVASGVESSPGIKNRQKMERFITTTKRVPPFR